ncbi:MAG: chemotaxis protein CheW [Leptolyngbyaceae cyanobacterium RU_5_1]|nr:chemotaxis protein CheW [Leptolyngbyaceae cyanobacterium RU_5_1]
MQQKDYLIFGLNDQLYGIEQAEVEEIFLLPELMLFSEVLHGIVGILDFRGEPLPVMDLNLSLGYPETGYRLTDCIAVVRCLQQRVGMIVHKIHDVRTVDLQAIASSYDPDFLSSDLETMVAGRVNIPEETLILHAPESWIEIQLIRSVLESLIHPGSASFTSSGAEPTRALGLLDKTNTFCPTATEEVSAIFRQRANTLKGSDQPQKATDFKSVVVFTLGNRLWGIDSNYVREFIEITELTPIPSCPAHIIGNLNLRGEILTLVDIRKSLDLPMSGLSNSDKAIVVEAEEVVVGVIAERVHDAMFMLNSQDILPAKNAASLSETSYLQGSAAYDRAMMGILDLPKILLHSEFIVDETV